jgi:hypothetical protein
MSDDKARPLDLLRAGLIRPTSKVKGQVGRDLRGTATIDGQTPMRFRVWRPRITCCFNHENLLRLAAHIATDDLTQLSRNQKFSKIKIYHGFHG